MARSKRTRANGPPLTTSTVALSGRAKAVPSRTGRAWEKDGHFFLHLDWIPASLKNRKGMTYDHKAGFIRHFHLKRVDDDIEAIREVWLHAFPNSSLHHGRYLWHIDITIYRPLTKGEIKNKRWNTRRGDAHNVPALIYDALEGIWFENDVQVTQGSFAECRYNDGEPGVRIEGWPLHE